METVIVPLQAFKDNYIWAWHTDDAQTALAVVDPGDALPVLAYARQHDLTLTSILLTHHHADHIGGVGVLLQQFPHCQVYAPEDARIPLVHHIVRANEPIQLNGLSFQVLATPGHTSTHICYYETTLQWLFCGDTLFSAGCGRVFDGTLEALFTSLQTINSLPETTQVFSAHEYTRANLAYAAWVEPENTAIQAYLAKLTTHEAHSCTLPSTLMLERQINPFLRTNGALLKDFCQRMALDINDAPAIFKCLREEKNKW